MCTRFVIEVAYCETNYTTLVFRPPSDRRVITPRRAHHEPLAARVILRQAGTNGDGLLYTIEYEGCPSRHPYYE